MNQSPAKSPTTPAFNFTNWQKHHAQRVESWLDKATAGPSNLNALDSSQHKLIEAMRYTLLGGGKRLRALLVYAGFYIQGHGADEIDYRQDQSTTLDALDAIAGAVEAVHAYSLVHDDLPCMDDDDMRRGRPTCHKIYGEAMALLAGDALHAMAFEWLINDEHLDATQRIMLIKCFAQAIGHDGMVGGQAIDIDISAPFKAFADNAPSPSPVPMSLSRLETMHRKKTGALIESSLLMGFMAGQSTKSQTQKAFAPIIPDAFTHYAKTLGLLFQVVDDYLDCTSTSSALGKTAGKDMEDGKLTYVALLGLEGTALRIQSLLDQLINDAALLSQEGFNVVLLEYIARWVANRDH